MSEYLEMNAAQARKELRLTGAALNQMEQDAINKLLETTPGAHDERLELIMIARVARKLPQMLQSHIDTLALAQHQPHEE